MKKLIRTLLITTLALLTFSTCLVGNAYAVDMLGAYEVENDFGWFDNYLEPTATDVNSNGEILIIHGTESLTVTPKLVSKNINIDDWLDADPYNDDFNEETIESHGSLYEFDAYDVSYDSSDTAHLAYHSDINNKIYYSTFNGNSWSSPDNIHDDPNAVLTYVDKVAVDTLDNDYTLVVYYFNGVGFNRYRRDAGNNEDWEFANASNLEYHGEIDAAFNRTNENECAVVYFDQVEQDLMLRIFDGHSNTPINISNTNQAYWSSDRFRFSGIVSDSEGNYHIAWDEYNIYGYIEVRYAKVNENGNILATHNAAYSSTQDNFLGSIDIDDSDNIYISYSTNDGSIGYNYYIVKDAETETWSSTNHITTFIPTNYDTHSYVTIDPNNLLHATTTTINLNGNNGYIHHKVYDIAPPTEVSLQVAEEPYYKNANSNFEMTLDCNNDIFSGLDHGKIYVGQQCIASNVELENGINEYELSATYVMPEGGYEMYVRVYDEAGNYTDSNSIDVYIDESSPTLDVSIANEMLYGAIENGTGTVWGLLPTDTPTFTFEANDPLLDDGNVGSGINDNYYTYNNNTESIGAGETEFTTGHLDEGLGGLVVSSYDNVGNNTLKLVGFVVDTQEPEVDITSGIGSEDGTISVEGEAIDENGSGIRTIIATLYSESVDPANYISEVEVYADPNHAIDNWTYVDVSSEESISVQFTGQAIGTYVVQVTVEDWVGLQDTEEIEIEIVDVTAPVITIDSPADQLIENSNEIAVDITVTDNTGLADLDIRYNNTSISIDQNDYQGETSYNYTGTITFSEDDVHEITVTAEDEEGNDSTESVELLTDTTRPELDYEITLNVRQDGNDLYFSPAISGTVTDSNPDGTGASAPDGVLIFWWEDINQPQNYGQKIIDFAELDVNALFADPSNYDSNEESFSDVVDELETDSLDAQTYTFFILALDNANNTSVDVGNIQDYADLLVLDGCETVTLDPSVDGDITQYVDSIEIQDPIVAEVETTVDLHSIVTAYVGQNVYEVGAEDITYSISDSNYGSIDPTTGILTVGNVVGSTTVTVSIGQYTDTADLTVVAANLAALTIDGDSALYAGQPYTYTVSGADEHGNAVDISNYANINFTILDENDNVCGYNEFEFTISANTCTITPKQSGNFKIYATYNSNAYGLITSNEHEFNVSLAPISSITVTAADTNVLAGESLDLQATAYDANGDQIIYGEYDIVWEVSEANGGTVTGSDLDATYTAPQNVGVFTVTATSQDYGVVGQISIAVSATNDLSMRYDEPKRIFTKGESETIIYTVSDTYDNEVDTGSVEFNAATLGVNAISIVSQAGLSDVYYVLVIPNFTAIDIDAVDPQAPEATVTISATLTDDEGNTYSLADIRDSLDALLVRFPDNTIDDVRGWLNERGFEFTSSTSGGTLSGYLDETEVVLPANEGNTTVTLTHRGLSNEETIIVSSKGPEINISINGEIVDPATLPSDYVIDNESDIEVTITDENGFTSDNVTVSLDSSALSVSGLAAQEIGAEAVESLDLSLASVTPFDEGEHTLVVEATDAAGQSSSTQISFKTYAALSIVGTPMNFPNPFSPSVASQTTQIKYTLTQDANIEIMIYDMTGNHILRRFMASGLTGASAGDNYFTWNGQNDFGKVCGNGVYIYFIISGGTVLGNGEIAIYQ